MKEPKKKIGVGELVGRLADYSEGAPDGSKCVNACYLGKVFLPVGGRHDPTNYSWSENFEWTGFKAIFPAQEAVKRQRKQGLQWVIYELPACIFHSSGGTLIVTEFRPGEAPLTGCKWKRPDGYELDSLAKAISDGSRDTVVQLTTSRNEKILPASFPFYTHRSGDKRFGWERSHDVCDGFSDAPFSPALMLLQEAAVWLQQAQSE